MKITAILHTHGNIQTTIDTLESVLFYMTDRVLLLVDGAGWANYQNISLPVPVLQGVIHDFYRNSYRNVIFGLLSAYKRWPDSDWYCYLEYDCLIGSSEFKQDLEIAGKENVWLLGNDYRDRQIEEFTLVEKLLGGKFAQICYILGACIFINQKFMAKAREISFFERFLNLTNDFQKGFFPEYDGWDLTEHLLPTLANYWGGTVQQFACWSKNLQVWTEGNYARYPVRWQPEIENEEEFLQAAIMHPVKSYNHPVRVFHRQRRENRFTTQVERVQRMYA